jgi:hypothetical protein
LGQSGLKIAKVFLNQVKHNEAKYTGLAGLL